MKQASNEMSQDLSILSSGLQIRRAEELLLGAFKKGQISGTIHTCLGQELIPVVAKKFFEDAFWFSNHRGHGHYLAKTGDFAGLFAEILGMSGGISSGKGGSQHIYSKDFISNGIQGGLSGIATGLSSQRNPKKRISVVFVGDGTLGAGHLYESWNLAALEKSKVLYVIEDNHVAQSTPSSNNFKGNLKDRVSGFGLNYVEASDNSILELIQGFKESVLNLESNIPTVLHISTKRLGPHSKGDDNRSKSHLAELQELDLLTNAIKDNQITYEDESIKVVDDTFTEVCNRNKATYNKTIFENIYWKHKSFKPKEKISLSKYINTILLNLAEQDNEIIFLGEDISDDLFNTGANYGGAFKVTSGLSSKFSKQVFSTPISESGITGFGIGLALDGVPTIIEIMFGDFLSQNFDQIFHQLAKIPSMYGKFVPLPVIIRTAVGGGKGYGPTHSSFMEYLLLGLPNIVVVCVNQFTDYSEILRWGFEQKIPLIILEPKFLYNEVYYPNIYMEYELDSKNTETCRVISPKNHNPEISIFVYGGATTFILESLNDLAEKHEIFVELVIPEILNPADPRILHESIKRCKGRLIVIDESMNGFGAGTYFISKLVEEGCKFDLLHLHLNDWQPNGSLENQVYFNKDKMISNVVDWYFNGK
jgi:2-oxoisovalerate dehydrogenase E1 component